MEGIWINKIKLYLNNFYVILIKILTYVILIKILTSMISIVIQNKFKKILKYL